MSVCVFVVTSSKRTRKSVIVSVHVASAQRVDSLVDQVGVEQLHRVQRVARDALEHVGLTQRPGSQPPTSSQHRDRTRTLVSWSQRHMTTQLRSEHRVCNHRSPTSTQVSQNGECSVLGHADLNIGVNLPHTLDNL